MSILVQVLTPIVIFFLGFWSSDHCATSILDLHRSCPNCSFELCLSCCKEIRRGILKARSEMKLLYQDNGQEYIHGGDPLPEMYSSQTSHSSSQVDESWTWKSNGDGSITCAPEQMGGCGKCTLELKRICSKDWIRGLLKSAENLLELCRTEQASCHNEGDWSNLQQWRRAASRDNSGDNCLYCPFLRETLTKGELMRFQTHWAKGEPVIVRNVLEQSAGLSWEPMVMWRALCEHVDSEISSRTSEVQAIDCLACCKVTEFLMPKDFVCSHTRYLYPECEAAGGNNNSAILQGLLRGTDLSKLLA